MKTIPLTQGKEALVDDEDFERVSKYKWHWNKGNTEAAKTNPDHTGYARREQYLGRENGKRNRKTVWMHRFIMNAPPGLVVDHIYGNGLNNQKYNLRVVTHEQNMNNMKNNVA